MPEIVEFDFDAAKNLELKKTRGISFEEVIQLIQAGRLLDVVEHPNKARYPNQQMYVLDVEGYVHLVPYVREENKIFLKTIYPSRKTTREYLAGKGG